MITKLDDQGSRPDSRRLFALERGSGHRVRSLRPVTGRRRRRRRHLALQGHPGGDWTLIETQAPVGFQPGPDQDITVKPGKTLNLEIKNEVAPPQPKGNLKVFKVNGKNQPLPGACFSLKQGNVTIVPALCDSADGSNDGTINFIGVSAGSYTLHETKKPSADYKSAADVSVTVVQNTTKTVKVVNER